MDPISGYLNNLHNDICSIPRDEKPAEKSGSVLSDSALGIGEIGSSSLSAFLPQKITPRVTTFLAGVPRFLGGAVTLLTSGANVAQAFKKDYCSNKGDYSSSRREVAVTTGSVMAGFATGSLVGLGVAGLATVGAPAAAVFATAAAGAVAVGYVATKTRDWLGNWYDKVMK